MTQDRILLTRLVVSAVIGVGEEERAAAQDLEVDLELAVDTRLAAATDRLHDAVDYVSVADVVRRAASSSTCHLVETLAERLAAELLASFPVEGVTLELRKRLGDLGNPAPRAGVRISRR